MGLFNWLFKKKKDNNDKKDIKTKADCEITEQKETIKPLTPKPACTKKSASKSAKKADDDTTAKKVQAAKAQDTKPKDANLKDKAEAKKKQVDIPIAEEIVQISRPSRCGKFEIKKTKDGHFVFNLYASNSVIVATSQTYSSSSAAMNGIKSTIANAAKAPIEDQTLKNTTNLPYPKWEIYLDKSEHYRFRLNASNGSTVCHSQGYTSKNNCKNGIESIRKFATDAEIVKIYLDKK